MNTYEVVYIFPPAMDEDGVDAKLERFHKQLTDPEGGEITAVDHWGVRQLAYPVRDQGQGYYVVAQFTTDPRALDEFERILKLDEELLRYLVVISEGEPTTGMSILAETEGYGEGEDEDDEDEEEEDDEDEDDDFGEGSHSPPEFAGGRGRRRRVEGPRIELLNYKDVATLSRFVTEQGKILPKRTTKVTARFQRQLGRAVKRARFLALLPYVRDHDR